MKPKLGTMTKEDIKGVWGSEREFCSWLAADGLHMLNELLNLSLEQPKEQVAVGRFFADVVCADSSDSDRPSMAVIEVQRNESDHDHLGKVITYAARLDDTDDDLKHVVKHVIWIAEEFTDEHAAALDWMNGYFGPAVFFHGVVVDVKKIDDSNPAVEFIAIITPKEKPSKPGHDGEFFRRYWTEVNQSLVKRQLVELNTPGPREYNQRQLGKVGDARCVLRVTITPSTGSLRAALIMGGSNDQLNDTVAISNLLVDRRSAIESNLKDDIRWEFPPKRKSGMISVTKSGFDVHDSKEWNVQFDWIANSLKDIELVYRDHVKDLKPIDHVPIEDYEPEQER